jgi:hypothetical protein
MSLLFDIVRIVASSTQQRFASRHGDAELHEIAGAVNSLRGQYESNERQRDTHEAKVRKTDEQRLLVEKIALGTVVAGTLIALVTLYFVLLSTNAARDAAISAAKQAELLGAQVHQGQRAYVLVEKGRLVEPPTAGHEPVLKVILRNSGQTPAMEVQTTNRRVVQKDDPPESDYVSRPQPGKIIIGAGQTREASGVQVARIPLTDSEISDILKGERRLFWYGKVEYTDVFGVKSYTDFCYFYVPGDAEMYFCETGNHIHLEPIKPQQ